MAPTTDRYSPPSDQAGSGRRWRRGQERDHHPVLPEAVRDRLRPHHRGLVHPAHRGGRTVVHSGCTGHGGAGGVQRHARAVHAQGRRLPAGVLRDGQAELREHPPLPHADPPRQGQRDVPDAAGGQQGGPRARARRERGGGPRAGAHAGRALHRDQRQGAAAQHRRRLPRAGAHHPQPPAAGGEAAPPPQVRQVRATVSRTRSCAGLATLWHRPATPSIRFVTPCLLDITLRCLLRLSSKQVTLSFDYNVVQRRITVEAQTALHYRLYL